MLSRTEARKILLSVPGACEKPYFNKPSVFYGDVFVGRVHDKEDAVVLRVGSREMRDVMLEADPGLFYITDHYRPWPFLLARLSALTPKLLKDLGTARAKEIDAQPVRKKSAREKAAEKMVAKKIAARKTAGKQKAKKKKV